MTQPTTTKDLVVLVADKDMEFAIRGVLERVGNARRDPLSCDIYVHPERDPGCLLRGHDFLRPFSNRYLHALTVLDYEGCGDERDPHVLEAEVKERLISSGWGDRGAAIIIYPELEIWVWSDSPQVDSVLGWERRHPDLRAWMQSEGMLAAGCQKPSHPKEALQSALRLVRKQHSSSLFQELASKVSLQRCTDPSFLKLLALIDEWLPSELTG